ncbi:uncharacterized protein [Engystomops pustulosus]|uniref:uncharacterized protein isoform X3 n=1 Tax=Engystomops pustulosus TaxID=76066 RepID=UPI003AFADDFD
MIDLSFLTEAEQEAILKVLNRDAELKKTEDQRVRELQDKVNDENELKYKSGQWFYEAKSRRHRDKIHGADLVRASIRKRKKPATIAELSQSSRNQSQRSWVNSINQDIFIPPELYGVMEPPDEKEEDLMPSKADTNQSAKRVSFKSPGTDKDVMKNGTASPSRQRKNPFNSEGALEERDLNIESPEPMLVNGQEGKKRDPMSSVYKLGVKLPYPSPIGSRRSSQEAEENPPMKQPPVPKPRKLVINGQPPEHSNSSLQREDSLNSKNKRKGILKRRSSSSSTDSESLRISQNIEPTKLVLPSSPILEAEQSPSFDDQILSDNSPDRQKQVRFSERVLQKPPTPNPESYSVRETDEFGILEPGSHYYDFDFVDHPHYEESKPTQHSQNITEVLSQRSLEEDPISLTLQTNPSEWKLEDPSQGIKINGVNGTLDESSPEISIDSAGTEPLYAEVKKSPKSTSSDQAKDIETDALMEPRFHSQGWKTENTEKPLEFGKSYGGGGKINYGLRSSTDQPGKGYASTNEDILAPEKATNVQSSSQNFVDEPKPGTNGDYFPKWRRPRSMEIDDVVAQPMAEQEFPNVNVRDYTDTFVKAYPENSSNNSLGEFKTETKRQTISLRNAPNVDGRQEGPSSNFPIAQNMSISSRPASGDFKTHDTFLRDGRDRRISPTSANFKVMSMKDRIHDTSREQMSNPSQFQSLRHFWNAEDKNWSKGDLDPSPEKILTNVSKRNKPTRADLKQRHSRDVPTDDQSLPSSFDSLSEEEQTSQKVTSWLAQTPTVYGVEEVDANEDQDHSGEEVMENIEKTLVYRKRQDEEFSNALQKLKHEALEAPVMPKTEHLRSEDFQVSPVKESGLFDRKENKTSILVKSAESRPATGFYERVVQISNKQSPAKEEEKFVEPPSQRYSTEVDEHVNRTVAPAKMANEFKIGFQKLQEEYESASSQCDDERQVEKSNLPSEEQQLIETNETVDITSVPKGNDHQEFISALKRLEMEASTPSIVEDEDEQPEEVATVNTVTPVKSSFQIGFDHHTPIENEGTFETPQKLNVTYAIQSSPPYNEDTNGIEEVVLKTTAPSKKDDNDLVDALNKLELEAAAEDSSVELEEVYEKPKITPTIQSARSNSGEQSFVTPSVDVQNLSSPTHSVESTPENEDAYLYRTRRSTQEADDTFDGQGKLPVEEPPIEKTISDTEESNSDYKNRLLRLEEEAAASITEEPEDESVRETFSVSPAPTKEVTISKKVFSSVETTPTELPSSQPKPDTYKELANVPQSPSDQSGSFPGSARNVLYTKPDSSEVLKSKQGLVEESNTSPQQMVTYSDKMEDETFGPFGDHSIDENEALQKNGSIPKTPEIPESKEDTITTNLERRKNWSNTSTISTEDQSNQPQPVASSDLLEFGKSGSGGGKIRTRSIDEEMTIDPDQSEVLNNRFILHSDSRSIYPKQGPSTDLLEFRNCGSEGGEIPSSSISEEITNADPEQPENLNTTSSIPIEDGSITPQQVAPADILQFGKSGSGGGKIQSSSIGEEITNANPDQPEILNSTSSIPVEDQPQQVSSADLLELRKSGSEGEEIPSSSIGEEITNADPEQPENFNTKSSIPIEDGSITPQQVANADSLQFGKSGSGGGKIQSSSIGEEMTIINPEQPEMLNSMSSIPTEDESIPPQPVASADLLQFGRSGSGKFQSGSIDEELTNANPDQPKIQNNTSSIPMEVESISPQQVSSTDLLQFGRSGSGGGKIQSRSIGEEIIITDADQPETLNNISPIAIEDESTPPQQVPSTDSLEFGKCGSGGGKIQSSSIDEKITFDPDKPETLNNTASIPIEDESIPPQQVPSIDLLEFGKSRSGSGKIYIDSFQKYSDPLEDGMNEKVEKVESSGSKGKVDSLDEGVTVEKPVCRINDQTEVSTQNEDQKKQEKEESVISKRMWEGDGSPQEATKEPVLSNTKGPFSPVKLSVASKSSSFDSDDQNSASLVTFKKVIVEDEEDPLSPVEQLKSFWENGKSKDTTKTKRDSRPSMINENLSDEKETSGVDPRSKFRKRHTIHHFFDKEKSTDSEKNLPGRSVSVGEGADEKRMKSKSFQSLKNFWNTSSKSDDKLGNKALPESKTKPFGSNPDVRIKEPFISTVKSRLAAKSLQDIREDPSVSRFQVFKGGPRSRKDDKNELGKNSSNSSAVNKFGKPISSVDIMPQESSIPSNYPKSSSIISEEIGPEQSLDLSNEKPELTEVVENSVAPIKFAKSEISLKLKRSQDEESGKDFRVEGLQSTSFESCPVDQNVYRDEENGEMNEKGRKVFLVKQSGFDAGSPVPSNVFASPQENKYPTEKVEASDSNEEVNETIEKTVIPPKTDLDDFDRKLQNLYNESLNTIDLPNGHMIKPENVDINEPTLNIGKVLQVSPINQDKNVQSPVVATGLQPVAINFSSKKTEMVNEDLDKPQQNIPTETTSADVSTEPLVDVNFYEVPKISSEKPTYELNGSSPRKLDINELSSEPNDYKVPLPEPEKQTKKEIMERIEEPVVLPRPRFDDFHEKLNQLYEESQKSQPNIGDSNNIAENETVGAENKANVYLYPVEPKKTFLESSPVNLDSSQIVSADPETLTDESAPPHSQAPDILGQEVNETMAKTIAPKRISTAKSLEELQKEALNEQEGGFVGNVPSGHMILNESHSNDQELKENSILETFPRNKDDAVQWRTEPTGYEELQEGTAESSAPFMAVRQSTPVKDKNSSLRKSTLELYLEAPYRRELSKSIDFDLSAYVTSDVNQYQSKLNSQKADTLGPVENTFPENAEKFKRMSQSVPTFLQDETDGRETDSASESSFQIGRHKKSPSSLTNLSGSSGMASMSSVSGSVMSVYSGDFGNVDVKGAIEFAIDYVEQLKEFHIFIYQCKDLAAADVKKQRSDPYVKSYLLPEKAKMGKRKTAVKKKTLNPIYNEILRYKIPQESLKSQTLNVSVWHHDALGRNSFLGEVNLNLAMWDFKVSQRHWFPLEPRTPVHGVGLENRGEMKLALMYIPVSPHETGKKPNTTGEVHIWIKECLQLPMLRENKINSFVKCTILPDTSRKSRQKTRTIDKTQSPFFNHTMVYDGFKEADLREACVELTAWDHNKLSNHFIGGLRLGFGTGKSYGTAVDWMDSSLEEATMWEKMIASPSTWIEGLLPLRMFKMAKLSKYT